MRVRLLVAGDFCPYGRVAEKLEHKEYQYVLGEIKDRLLEVDYSLVNFECPVVTVGEWPIPKQGPNLKCSEKGIEAIKWAGFNCVTLANNHFLDYGKIGVENTLNACRKFELDIVGGGQNLNEASKILYKDVKGKRIAIINCCEHEFSIATYCSAGSNPLNPIKQYYEILDAKKQADMVLVIVHGGHEHFQLPSPRMVDTYRFFVDAGADAVFNHHQHCYSGYEIYRGKPIFYGLGNFCFDGNRSKKELWYEGYLVTIYFGDSEPSFEIHPYRQCAEEPRVILLPQNAFDKKLKELNGIIADSDALQKYIEKHYTRSESIYSNVFEPIQNRLYLGAKRRGWVPSLISKKRKLQAFNYINCEAHRDKLLYWLKKEL